MKRRNIVRLVSFLSAIIVFLCGIIIKNDAKKDGLKLEIENNYSKNLSELSAAVNNINLLLKKARYTTSPAVLSQLAAEILTEAEISKSALSQLPSGDGLDTLNRFLSQAGNYAFAVSARLYSSGKIPDDYESNISFLSDTAEKVSEIVSSAQVNFDNSDYWAMEIEKEIDDSLGGTLSQSLQELEGQLSDYPTLIYDGPYSDHILQSKPKMLEGEAEVDVNTARRKAIEFLGDDNGAMELVAEEKGKIEGWRFGGKNTSISVSRQGGHIVYMRKAVSIEKNILSYKQAISKAKRFLAERGLDRFIDTYYFVDEGVCVINFAYIDGQTVCYTDLLKVGVAMDNGEIVLYEASGYLSNHRPRAFESVEFEAQEAAQKVSSNLQIKKTTLVLIPTKSGKEVRCYEFLCTDGEAKVLVYINVLTLAEEEVLILFETDGGILAK